MCIGVFAAWYPKPGREDAVEALLRTMREHTRREPGCLRYELHRIAGGFLLYEQYVDAEAIVAHHATEHYRHHVRGRAPELLLRREIVRGPVLARRGAG
jgi:quinol monooxygenase YgiN